MVEPATLRTEPAPHNSQQILKDQLHDQLQKAESSFEAYALQNSTSSGTLVEVGEANSQAQNKPTDWGKEREKVNEDHNQIFNDYLNSSENTTKLILTESISIDNAFRSHVKKKSSDIHASENHHASKLQDFIKSNGQAAIDTHIDSPSVLLIASTTTTTTTKTDTTDTYSEIKVSDSTTSDNNQTRFDITAHTDNIRLPEQQQQQIDNETISADQNLHLKERQNSQPPSSPVEVNLNNNSDDITTLGFRLRALSSELSALQENPWARTSTLSQNIHASSLSNELINETLNYFVNCRQRLSQMTKAYDDNDAYILLLQEKEVDLELAARIGQDLLKQNKQLKDSIQNLENELTKRQEDVQQLKHELASKISLLDTFIEEEEHQTSLAETLDDLTFKQQEQILNKSSTSAHHLPQSKNSHINTAATSTTSECYDDHGPSGFLSLNYNQSSTPVEPFSSLPCQLVNFPPGDSAYPLTRDESSDTLGENINTASSKSADATHKLVENVTFQLVQSNKRLCELQDELFYKGEQNMLQQEKIYHLQDQLKESDRRVDGIAAENESLRKSIIDRTEIQKELSEELKACKQNFSELLSVFLELQKESRINRNLQQNSNATFYTEMDPAVDINNISFDSYNTTPFDHHHHQNRTHTQNNTIYDDYNNKNIVRPMSSTDMVMSSSLHEEIQESMHKVGRYDHSDYDATDEADSGVHSRTTITTTTSSTGSNKTRISPPSSLTPAASAQTDTDSEDASMGEMGGKKTWSGFSSFMLGTLFMLCLSVTLTTSTNSNIAQRFQIKLDR